MPVGKPITLHMITPLYTPGSKNLEVIHSFWVPQWGVKQDATPGVTGKTVATTYVKPTRPAPSRCNAPSCADRATARCTSRTSTCSRQADFDKWLAGEGGRRQGQAQAASNPGLAVFNNAGCSGCHTSSRPRPPARSGGPGRRDRRLHGGQGGGQDQGHRPRGFIKESILTPNAYIAKGFSPGVMPQTFSTSLSSKQVDDLSAYLAKGGAGS